MSKKLNELRPFDLEAAKAGATLYDMQNHLVYTLAAEAGPDGDAGVRSLEGNVFMEKYRNLRMAPLCWIEDRPVYKGDVLWNKNCQGLRYDVDYVTEYGTVITVPNETRSYSEHPEKLTWTRPYLCLVEGRPVYKGDELYLNWSKGPSKVRAVAMDCDLLTIRPLESQDEDLGFCSEDIDDLTWVAPARKVKKEAWLNVYSVDEVVTHHTKELADECATDQRKACIRIEWEEEA